MASPSLPRRLRFGVPRFRAYSILFRDSAGLVRMVRLIWSTRASWRRRPEASDPAWGVCPVGRFVVACRLDGSSPD